MLRKRLLLLRLLLRRRMVLMVLMAVALVVRRVCGVVLLLLLLLQSWYLPARLEQDEGSLVHLKHASAPCRRLGLANHTSNTKTRPCRGLRRELLLRRRRGWLLLRLGERQVVWVEALEHGLLGLQMRRFWKVSGLSTLLCKVSVESAF